MRALARIGAALALALSSRAPAADVAAQMSVQRDVVFGNPSPLARAETLLARVMSPLLREKVRADAAATGLTINEQSIDLANERFSLYVPVATAPAAGFGLLVYVSPFDKAAIPSPWLPVLARHRLIAVSAANSGNDENVMDRRIPLALAGYENVGKRYRLDPARVYVGGLSGGSRVALRLALAFPDVFRGALLNAGSDPIGTIAVPLPDAGMFRLFEERSRLVYVTGSEDAAALVADTNSRDSARDACFFDLVTLTMHGRGHEAADPVTFGHALDALDAPRTSDARADACRAARDNQIGRQLAAVEKHMEAGDRHDAVRQLDAIDAHFGGLAAPTSVEIAHRLSMSASAARRSSKP